MPGLIRSLFGGVDGSRHEGEEPPFDPREFFSGKVRAWGFVQDRSGSVRTRFEGVMEGSWDGDSGTLDETFTYREDGRVHERRWSIARIGDGRFEATAGDVAGKATGRVFGSAVRWSYVMEVPVGGRPVRFRFEDWTWAMGGGAAINRAYLRKLGLVVAELTVFMQKEG